MTEEPRQIGFEHLDRQEQAACLIAARVLGAVEIEAWDVPGRTGAVDAMLTLPDRGRAAFEVTNLAGEGALQLAMLLAKDNHRWPLPGDWWWTIDVGSVDDLRRLKRCYKNIIGICERAGQPHPSELAWQESAHEDLKWLVYQSSSEMTGFPQQLARDMKNPGAMVVPAGGVGWADEELRGFGQALEEAFKSPHIVSHFDKLAKAEADERHLFIPLHDSALPFPVSTELVFAAALPSAPPPIPEHVTHLWLAPAGSRRVLLWTRDAGWCNVPSASE